jgi:phospholipid/cholesterol/gamma-HCH transport system substrate-binding protein
MSTSNRTNPVWVGLLVSGALVVLLGTMLSVGMVTDLFRDEVRVTTVLDTVDGLKEGDQVWYSGVPVGKVSDLHLAGPGKVEVTLELRAREAEYIPADVKARLSSDGFIGNRIISLDNGTETGPRVADGAQLQAKPYVSTDELMSEFQETNHELIAIAKNVNEATTRLLAGEGTLGKLLTDDSLYLEAEATVASLERTARNAEAMTADGARFTARLDDEGTLAHSLMTDTTTYPKLQATVDQLQAVATDAEAITDEVAAATRNPDTPIGVMLRDEGAGADLDGTLDHLHTSSLLLAENLEAMQHNFLLRGFFKKKEKRELEHGIAHQHVDDHDAVAEAPDDSVAR